MKSKTLLHGLIWLLVLVATATGVFYRTPGAPIEYLTVRGERAVFQGNGLYRYDPAALAREGIIWDAVNLFAGLPLFGLAIFLAGRGSLRGRLLLGGLLGYFFYVYLMYAVMIAFNRLFLVYVAIFSLSIVAFFLNLGEIDVPNFPRHISPGFPRRFFIGFSFVFAAALILLWLGRIVPIMATGRFPAELAGMATLETQALDLGMVVPLALFSGFLLWRRSAWGYLLAALSLTFGMMMCLTIPAWIVIPLLQEGKINPYEAVPFLLLCLGGLVLAGMFYRNLKEPVGGRDERDERSDQS